MNNVIHCSSIHYIYGEVITRKLGLGEITFDGAIQLNYNR